MPASVEGSPGVSVAGSPRVVIIGAGIVGCALADELTARGASDVTVLEQGPLFATGGSSSHAPGLVFQTNGSKTMTDFARYTVEKYTALRLDGIPCFAQVGGLELATTPERVAELHRRRGLAAAWGVAGEVISATECARLHPAVDAAKVRAGYLVPTDGLAKPVAAAEAQGRRAIERGARFVDRATVVDLVTEGGRITGVVTDSSTYRADVVVCCAGIWGPRIARLVGLTLPLVPLAHQYARTGQLPVLAGQRDEAPHPILRHQDADLYYREHHDRLGIGYYGHRPMPVSAYDLAAYDSGAAMPSMLPFTEEDFAPAWEETRELLISATETKVEEGFNGLFSFTTDTFPLMGESPDVAGFWVAEAVWITHSAGVAKAIAEWLVDGAPKTDVHECDLNRFEAHSLGPAHILDRACQNFVEVYDILHPLQPMEAPRPLRTSPFYPRQQELGAVQLEASGWERPHWYEANAALVTGRESPARDGWAARYWSPIAAAEALATRDRVGLYDMTPLKRLEVTGPGALDYLQRMTTNNLAKSVGSLTYTLLLAADGGVRSDLTVARLAEQRFQVGANGNLDLDWLRRWLPRDGSVQVRDITPGTCCVGVWGPSARDLVQPLTSTDFSNAGFGYFRAKAAYVGQVPVTALRLSYVGELGWELYTTADLGLKLWDTLWAAGRPLGVVAGGRSAFSSLRLEKGYRSWGADVTAEHDPYEAGLGFAVRMDKGDFLGRDAIEGRSAETVTRRLTCLTIDDRKSVVMGKEPVYAGAEPVGYVTSAAYGYTVGCGIAYAWLPATLSSPGTRLNIDYFGERVAATVATEPLFDPTMTRLRS